MKLEFSKLTAYLLTATQTDLAKKLCLNSGSSHSKLRPINVSRSHTVGCGTEEY
jgi:hypothetical protein